MPDIMATVGVTADLTPFSLQRSDLFFTLNFLFSDERVDCIPALSRIPGHRAERA